MVPYFLASNLAAQNSKYAPWTIMDIVVELSASRGPGLTSKNY